MHLTGPIRLSATSMFRFTLFFALAVTLLAGKSLAAAERPNVVLMLADDLGWNAVGYHGNWVKTPNIDRIASDGIELDRFYVAPMCSPTRAGIMTGRYPIRFGLARAVIPPYCDYGLPVEERTLPEALADAGYQHRGIFGKWHLGHHQLKWHPNSQGFTHFVGHYNGAIDYFDLTREGVRDWHVDFDPSEEQGYSTDLVANAACAFIREAAKDDAPYFCYIPFNAPHSPFQAKEDALKQVNADAKPNNSQIYRAMIWTLDQAVGQVLDAVEQTGEADNTQVWFLSDNGGVGQFPRNNRPLRGAKLTTFEGGVRVVACVRWPAGWKGGRKIENTMGYIDIMPTILASAGIDPASGQPADRPLDGVSVNALLNGTASDFPERDWYSYHGQPGPQKETIAIKTANWKLIVNGPDIRDGIKPKLHQIFLFAMPGDLLEQNNVADQHPEIVQQLTEKLVAHRKLQPEEGVPPYGTGQKGFEPWKNWDIKLAPQK